MSLIPHSFFPRSMFDMDVWHRPRIHDISTLDLFDPFDELDHTVSRNLSWIDRPHFVTSSLTQAQPQPRVADRYRITIDCSGYNPKSIATKVSEDKSKLIVTAKDGEVKADGDDYSVREFKKTYSLPGNVETEKLTSFLTSNGNLVIEMPIKREEHKLTLVNDGHLQVVDENGLKTLKLNLSVPTGIDPSKIKVTCKDRDLIVQAEEKTENDHQKSQVYYYRRSTLPENTDFSSLKCSFENNQLSITAPVHPEQNTIKHTNIPITH